MIPVNEVPYDAKLPQMSIVMDTVRMQKIFQDRMFGKPQDNIERETEKNELQVLGCGIESVKYKPGKNCMICYKLDLCDTKTGRKGAQILCARIFNPGSSLSRFKKAQSGNFTMPVFGKPLSYIPDIDMVIWAFPNDRKLDGLPDITDAVYLKDNVFPEIIKILFNDDWAIESLKNELVHYVPEHTCTVRSHLHLQNCQTNIKESILLYGKTYYNEEGEEAFHIMRQLWESESRRSGKLRMAQPLKYYIETKTLWQKGLAGTTLIEQKLDSSALLTLMERAASTVAALHMTSILCSRTIYLNDLLEKLREMRQLLLEYRPSCKKTVDPLIKRLILQANDLDCQFTGTLHGDLHLKNFFVNEGNIALIDMDNLCNGATLLDVGSFIAGLVYRGMLIDVPEKTIDKLVAAFVQEYEKNILVKVCRSTLKWHVATALINERVFRCLKRLKAGRMDILDNLIKVADKISTGAKNHETLW